MSSIVITLIGPDRPGLVDSLAAVIADQGANWMESRMAHLGGQFAGILHVETDAQKVDALVAALERVEGIELTVGVDERSGPVESSGHLVKLELVGNDRPGIVAEISHVFTELGINVETIHTDCQHAPMSGGQLFHASASLQLPVTTTTAELRDRLEQIAVDLMVDVTISES